MTAKKKAPAKKAPARRKPKKEAAPPAPEPSLYHIPGLPQLSIAEKDRISDQVEDFVVTMDPAVFRVVLELVEANFHHRHRRWAGMPDRAALYERAVLSFRRSLRAKVPEPEEPKAPRRKRRRKAA